MADKHQAKLASIRARLRNIADSRGWQYQTVLETYALERLIHRLNESRYRRDFLLKGGMLVVAWDTKGSRATRDVDFTGIVELDADDLVRRFSEILLFDAEDGITFSDNFTFAKIRGEQAEGGIRLKTTARIGNIKLPITIDVGLDASRAANSRTIDYPTLLGEPIPNVRCYPAEFVMAEKFHALIEHGKDNTRMKDYYDLHVIPQCVAIDRDLLTMAITSTFVRRGTDIPTSRPAGLSSALYEDQLKQSQWRQYLERLGVEEIPALESITNEIWETLRASLIQSGSA